MQSTVDGTIRASELSQNQLNTLCAEVRTYVEQQLPGDDAFRGNCALLALTTSPTEQACDASVTQCLEASGGEGRCAEEGDFDDCDATVAQVLACTREAVELQKELNARVTCDLVGNQSAIMSALEDLELSAECQRIQERCSVADED